MTRFSIEQLEHMTTHELADLLSTIVLLLRRLPNIPWQELEALCGVEEPGGQHPRAAMRELLNAMCIADLREIAEDLHMRLPARMKKDELITKILVQQDRQVSHYQQDYALQES